MTGLRPLVCAAVALLTLGGCGAATPDERTSRQAPADAGTITVSQSGATPERTIWYVRIETTQAEPVVEKGFPGARISLTQDLKPGQYRVISWYRACQKTCPSSGEKGLGPLEEVCGAPVSLAKGQRLKTTVTVGLDGCQITVE